MEMKDEERMAMIPLISHEMDSANADVAVRVRSRGNGYYGYVGMLTIIEA